MPCCCSAVKAAPLTAVCVFLCERYNFQFIKRRFVWEFPQIRVSVVFFFSLLTSFNFPSPCSFSALFLRRVSERAWLCLWTSNIQRSPLCSPLAVLSSLPTEFFQFISSLPTSPAQINNATAFSLCEEKKKIQTQTYKWAFLVCSCELKPVDLMWRRLHFCSAVLSSVSFSVLTSDQFINHTDSAAVEMMTIKTVSVLDRSPSNSCHSLWWRGNRFISSVSDTQISSR